MLWFAGTLVPMIGLVQAGSAAMADRHAYLPFIALAAVSVTRENSPAYNNLAVILGESGDHSAALDHFQQALAIDPDHPRAKLNPARTGTMLQK